MLIPTGRGLRAMIPPHQRRQFAPLKPLARRFFRLARPAWMGTLRRTTPLSDDFGFERGTPLDRYYLEQFLREHRQDIRGCALEVRTADYVDRFGVDVERREVLDLDPTNPHATIVADLTRAEAIPSDSFDCFVLTQTLQFIYDTRAALREAHRILRPGGVLLATVPSVSRIDDNAGVDSDYWRFTTGSCRRLFGEVFGEEQIQVKSYGNVLAGIAFLAGMAQEELRRRELNVRDDLFPVIVAVRAVKGSAL
jgi:SAM-dependent methyltransferase